jgi:hypothetical protein
MTDITDFITAAIQNKPVAAQAAFDDIMQAKTTAAVETDYAEYVQSMFNNEAVDDSEGDDSYEEEQPEEVESEEFETNTEDNEDV